jgi:RNA polymerase sigma factor (sigma-70 family)
MAEIRSDGDLLRDYVERRSESAFAELVERHTNLVFATASRGVTDPVAAQEVTQNVFIALARKAAGLRREATVAGWLHKTTLLEVRQWWRGEMRRRKREQTAFELGTTMKDEESLLKSMSGLLDDGLLHLRDSDRQLLLLRYIEERSHREIGQVFGTGEDAVRKRIDKALEALTDFFRRRGFAVPAATTTAAMLSAAAQTAPAGLSAIVTKAALASAGAVSVTGIGALLGYIMGLTKTQIAAICLAVAAIPLSYQWKVNNQVVNEQNALKAQLAATAAMIASQNDDAGAMNRRLLQIQNRQAALEARPVANPALAVVGAPVAPNDPPPYQWSEQSPYVMVPKSALKDLGLPALPRIVNGPFSLSPVMTEALSLQPAELSRVNTLLAETKAAHDRLVTSHAQPTNGHIQWFRPNTGPMRSFIVAPFPEEGDLLMARLKSDLEQALGSQRTELLWPHAEASLRDRLSEIGKVERWLTVHLSETPDVDPRPAYYEDVRGKYGRGLHGDPPTFLKRAAEEAQQNQK